MWFKTFVVDENEPNVDLNCILSDDGIPEKAGKLCKKCQYTHERYSNQHNIIQDNMKKAIDAMPCVFPSTPIFRDTHLAYAVSDRIDCSNLSDQVITTTQICPDRIAASLLPSVEDDLSLRRNICTLMFRVLCDNVTYLLCIIVTYRLCKSLF